MPKIGQQRNTRVEVLAQIHPLHFACGLFAVGRHLDFRQSPFCLHLKTRQIATVASQLHRIHPSYEMEDSLRPSFPRTFLFNHLVQVIGKILGALGRNSPHSHR